jgi:hypothetical protein
VPTPIESDRLWSSVAEAEQSSRRGTELLAELKRLLVRGDAFSELWLEDRRKLRELIEAHLSATGEVKARLHEARRQSSESVEARLVPIEADRRN